MNDGRHNRGRKPSGPAGVTAGRGAVVGLALLAAAAGVSGVSCRGRSAGGGTAVTRGPFSVWSVYEGKLESRRVEVIMSRFSGSATIAELAPEGSRVKKGDLLVRFDDAQVKTEFLRLKRDGSLAKSELDSLQHAKIPIESRELDLQHLETRANYEAEKQYLDDSLALRKEDLVSAQEVEQQKLKVEQVRSKLEKIELETKLTKEYLIPAKLDRATATLEAAQQALDIAREQLDNCCVRAPCDGMVMYRPMYVGTEYRTVRVGDTIFKNQPFMSIPDMSNLVVECYVPEAELSLVSPGRETTIVPLAYPGLQLKGRVETVGSMAQAKPGHADWQKYFGVTIAVEKTDDRLRSGMSVHARILSYRKDNAVLVPRSAVTWDEEKTCCRVRTARGEVVREVKVGRANTRYFEVLEGLEPGEVVVE